MMIRACLLGMMAAATLTAAALAQAPAPGTPSAARPASPNAAPRAAAPGQAQPAPRVPRSFEVCTREAMARRYRGAERRHFVSRCQLGYGRRLFRRRGPATT